MKNDARFTRPLLSMTVAYVALQLFVSAPISAAQPSEDKVSLRVGIVAFQDFVVESQKWERFLRGLQFSQPVAFKIALGTHAEVLHWMDQEMIDIAIMPPGAFALSLDKSRFPNAAEQFRYLLTVGYPKAVSKFAHPSRKTDGFHYEMHCVAVVDKDSKLQTFDDLLEAAPDLRYVFLHPISASGRLLAESVLTKHAVEINRYNVEFSYSHSTTLRIIAHTNDGIPRVGFVHDDALRGSPELSDEVRAIPIPDFDATAMPQDVIVVRKGMDLEDEVQAVMSKAAESLDDIGLKRFDDWTNVYQSIFELSRESTIVWDRNSGRQASLDEIGRILVHHAQTQGTPPRLAVVLAGGGAKCSYQVGVVSALEEMLSDVRGRHPGLEIDINLVVGTSGGAVNALPVAMGVTSTESGRRQLQDIWKSLDQREIIQLAPIPKMMLGLWFAIIQFGVVVFVVRRIVPRSWFAFCAGGTLITIAVSQIAVAQLDYTPWTYLGENHLIHHLWLILTFGVRTSSLMLCFLGVALILLVPRLSSHGTHREDATWLQRRGSGLYWLALFVVMVAGFGNLCFVQETLSAGAGVEKVITEGYAAMLNERLRLHNKAALEPSDDQAEWVANIGQTIMQEGMLKRDLVVTGSLLDAKRKQLPDDLYFYAKTAGTNSGTSQEFGHRGIAIVDHQSLLLDIVMGSGSIFPLFPPRRLRDFPEPSSSVELIDGGFAHNSPIEAAVLWKATHIILIEAAPPMNESRGKFLANIATAFGHLHEQTQQIDYRSKRQVVAFTLTPRPPHICVLDFADNLIAKSIQRGYDDAMGKNTVGTVSRRNFKKELGEPVFFNVRTRE